MKKAFYNLIDAKSSYSTATKREFKYLIKNEMIFEFFIENSLYIICKNEIPDTREEYDYAVLCGARLPAIRNIYNKNLNSKENIHVYSAADMDREEIFSILPDELKILIVNNLDDWEEYLRTIKYLG